MNPDSEKKLGTDLEKMTRDTLRALLDNKGNELTNDVKNILDNDEFITYEDLLTLLKTEKTLTEPLKIDIINIADRSKTNNLRTLIEKLAANTIIAKEFLKPLSVLLNKYKTGLGSWTWSIITTIKGIEKKHITKLIKSINDSLNAGTPTSKQPNNKPAANGSDKTKTPDPTPVQVTLYAGGQLITVDEETLVTAKKNKIISIIQNEYSTNSSRTSKKKNKPILITEIHNALKKGELSVEELQSLINSLNKALNKPQNPLAPQATVVVLAHFDTSFQAPISFLVLNEFLKFCSSPTTPKLNKALYSEIAEKLTDLRNFKEEIKKIQNPSEQQDRKPGPGAK